MQLHLGIDIACRAPHQASLADEQGRFVWSGRRFRTNVGDLKRLWAELPEGTDPWDLTVIMEPTRNAWVPLAAWFRRRGARVVLVPPERSADLRAYYAKHTKTDRIDSRLLARLPLLHPEGLHEERGLGPGDALRRATRIHSTLTKRRSQCLARLDALLEILGPSWLGVFESDLSNKTPLRFLAAGYASPHTVKRLGAGLDSPGSSPATHVGGGENRMPRPCSRRRQRPSSSGRMTSTSMSSPRTSRSRHGWRFASAKSSRTSTSGSRSSSRKRTRGAS